MSTKLKGIDVSKWQGTIDWTKVKAAGIQFAIIRAGYGKSASQIDSKFETNYKNAKAAGIPVGVYWYAYATSESGAKAEAEACLEVISGKTFDLPVFYDMEYEPGILALTTAVRTAMVKKFCETIEAAGFTAGVYSSTDFATNKLTASKLSAWMMWIAQYASTCKYTGDYDIWQYSSTGSVSGISGNVDMDYIYKEISSSSTTSGTKTVAELAEEVIAGKWGNGDARKSALEAAGYDYSAVQAEVNSILNGSAATSSGSSGSTSSGQTVTKEVKASAAAQKYDKSLAGTYKTTANLYCRDGAGTSKKALCLIPKGTSVQNYGYYSLSGSTKWLYIQFTMDGVQYTGFSSSGYLTKTK